MSAEEAWQERFDALERWRREVAEAAAGVPSRPRLRVVCCARTVGTVVQSPLGPLLVVEIKLPQYAGSEGRVSPSRFREISGQRETPRRKAWPVEASQRYGTRFPWRPPDEDDAPVVTCRRHGAAAVNLDTLSRLLAERRATATLRDVSG
jgi:hypothetical protein